MRDDTREKVTDEWVLDGGRHNGRVDPRQADLLRDIDPAVLGGRIRAARVAGGLTQGQLAGVEVTVGYISRIESGQRRPESKLLATLAARLGTTVDHLLLGISTDELTELRLAVDYAELALESGQPGEAERRITETLDRLREASEQSLVRRARLVRARSFEVQGRLDEAIIELEDLTRGDAPDPLWIKTTIALSRCYRQSGDFARAIDTGEQAIDRLDAAGLGGTDEAVQLAVTVAAAHHGRGDTGHAVRLCRRAITKAEEIGSPTARAAAYWNASVFEAEQGANQAALELADRALALFGEGEDARNLARLRSLTGMLHLRLDPPEVTEARRILTQAGTDLATSSASMVDLARNDLALARSHYLAGQPDQAQPLAEQALQATRASAPTIAADACALLGQIAAEHTDTKTAHACYRDAIFLLTGIGADKAAAELWFELATLLDELGDHDAARDAYRSAAASTGLRSRPTTPAKR